MLEKCSPGWDSFQGACYKHFSTRRSWEDAETQCRHYGGHLATILTPEEQDFINGMWCCPGLRCILPQTSDHGTLSVPQHWASSFKPEAKKRPRAKAEPYPAVLRKRQTQSREVKENKE